MLSAPLVSQFFFYGSEEAEMMKRRKHTAALQDETTAASLYMWVWTTHRFIFDLILRWQEIDELASWLLVVFFSCFHSSVCSQGKLLNSPPAAIEKCKPKHPTVTEFPKQHCDLFYSGSRSNKCVFTRTFFISSLRWIWALSTDSDTQYYNY